MPLPLPPTVKTVLKLTAILLILMSSLLTAQENEESPSRLTYDISVSAGSQTVNNERYHYTEYHLGLNWQFASWLTWRNSGFYRTVPEEVGDDFYGLDSSARLSKTLVIDDASRVRVFAGGGYRIPSEGRSAPLADAGIDIQLGGLRVGAGVKVIFSSAVDKNLEDDKQYFFTLAGGGRL